ncbi:hypothetical protein [Bacillus toyonensis]|uniref:hypothetical protein n=1 Tax=Bacillus toyonensis TaxID=155322 RepID=UPI002E21DBF4|nr:hypothetical protein [Bacillus toyonensis]
MLNIRDAVIEKLIEKGFSLDEITVNRVIKSFSDELIENEFYEILEQVIELSDLEKSIYTIENIELGKLYELLPIDGMKPSLHHQKVMVLEKLDQTMKVQVATGQMRGKEILIETDRFKTFNRLK